MSTMFKTPFSNVFINTLLLILSGFPFQINLKQQDSISFVYLSGTVQELAMNVNFGQISDFIIIIIPIMVRFLFSQDINNFFIWLISLPNSIHHICRYHDQSIYPMPLLVCYPIICLLFYLYNFFIFQPTSPVFYFYLTLNQIMIQKFHFHLEQMSFLLLNS